MAKATVSYTPLDVYKRQKVGCWVPIEIMTNTNRIFAEIAYADQPQLELRTMCIRDSFMQTSIFTDCLTGTIC